MVDYPLGTIDIVQMADEEMVAYDAVNVAYDSKWGASFSYSSHLFETNWPTIWIVPMAHTS